MRYIIMLFFSILLGFSAVGLYFIIHKQVEVKQIPLPTPVFTFSLQNPPPQSFRGAISSITGDVLWQGRIATEESALSKDTELLQGSSVETLDNGKISIQFPAFLVMLSPNTKIEFIQTIPQNIVLFQKSGIGKYIQDGDTPVTIRANGMIVEQKNGEMTISIKPLTGHVVISALKGTGTVAYEDPDNLSTVVNLEEENQYVYYPEYKSGEIIP